MSDINGLTCFGWPARHYGGMCNTRWTMNSCLDQSSRCWLKKINYFQCFLEPSTLLIAKYWWMAGSCDTFPLSNTFYSILYYLYADKSWTYFVFLLDFPVALRRLLKNDILLCRTASSVLHILPIAGLYTFLPKYIESQFRMTATEANMVSGDVCKFSNLKVRRLTAFTTRFFNFDWCVHHLGIAGILVMGVGIFASGMYMRRYKPNPRFVAGWIATTALAYAIGMVILSFLGCPLDDLASQQGSLR